jgi:KDO2-lipid IV(A) lauroyltransferase
MSLLHTLKIKIREPLARTIVRGFALLPMPFNHALGTIIGYLLYLLPSRIKHISRVNIEMCLTQHDTTARHRILRKSLINVGKAITETGPIWLWPQQKTLQLIRAVENEHLITQGLEQQKGVILLVPHLACWEIMGVYLTSRYPMTMLYRPHRIQSLTQLMIEGRERQGGKLAPTDIQGVRLLIKSLKNNELTAVLPDQDPGYEKGEFAPFFGHPANTMTLLSKILQKTGARAISAYAERLPNGQGYHIHFYDADPDVNSSNLTTSLTAVNREVEQLILRCPDQYQWGYPRFRRQPDKLPNPY